MKNALYFEERDDRIVCRLCPRNCVLKEGENGFCGVRANREGKGVTLNYGSLSAVHIDPIEKKPLYHFMPGREILSLGSYGCNLTCLHCQNHAIAQDSELFTFADQGREITPAMILDKLDSRLAGVAYTYNEPVVWYEYVLDCARAVKERGFKNVMVTNGFIQADPLDELFPFIHAFSVDLKGYSGDFYRLVSGGSLKPVQESLKRIVKSGRHLEVEYLVIPGMNDEREPFEELLGWYARELGPRVPLHINRYFPQYKMERPATPVETLVRLYETAREYLDYVYIGNADVSEGRDTRCPACGEVLIERAGYRALVKVGDDICPRCGTVAEIIF